MLSDTFEAIRPGIVAFISRLAPRVADAPPLLPLILGTGFFVDRRGLVVTNRHVVDVIAHLPRHPVTGASSAAGIVFLQTKTEDGSTALGTLFADVNAWWILDRFEVTGPWYGESVPDLAFVQLKVTDTPELTLATEPHLLQAGTAIATAGFPLGEIPLQAHNKIRQLTPMLRRGVVSSVFPFPCAQPHGFTIDVMMQKGASGSPVFLEDSPKVVGMIVEGYAQTNITVALPAFLVVQALKHLLRNIEINTTGVPTLVSQIPERPVHREGLQWETFVAAGESETAESDLGRDATAASILSVLAKYGLRPSVGPRAASLLGLLAPYGSAPSAEDIDENRREMFGGFGSGENA